MSMKPILFNAEMVRALLEGRKTVARRVVKFPAGWNPQWTGYIPDGPALYGSNNIPAVKAPYKPGDILWVRETWSWLSIGLCDEYLDCNNCVYYDYDYGCFQYRTDYGKTEDDSFPPSLFKWRPSIHMPREAARIWLRVTNVRVERLQDMTEESARADDFASRAEAIQAILAMYPDCTEDSWFWVIQFERISREEANSGNCPA